MLAAPQAASGSGPDSMTDKGERGPRSLTPSIEIWHFARSHGITHDRARRLSLLKTPNRRENLEIFASPPYCSRSGAPITGCSDLRRGDVFVHRPAQHQAPCDLGSLM